MDNVWKVVVVKCAPESFSFCLTQIKSFHESPLSVHKHFTTNSQKRVQKSQMHIQLTEFVLRSYISTEDAYTKVDFEPD